MKYGIVIRYEFDRSWLQLSREQRGAKEEVFQKEIVGPFADKMSVRHFDAEAFATNYSDFLLVETDDIKTYYYFIEKLRDSEFIAQGWVHLRDISIGLQDGYKEYENDQA
ncbi:darcynin family protein [Streptomyces sp. LUP47B]|uniref:darcynin family protein n=1 Tax=unclassified Streptomyces TaxID=2593676 RepID=UPI000851773D|nr:darcynin family protein [Streptomyces sp. LUP47B]